MCMFVCAFFIQLFIMLLCHVQRTAVTEKETLFGKKNEYEFIKELPPEDMFSATDLANLDDDTDDELTLIELARKCMSQARSSEPWKDVRPDSGSDMEEDVEDMDQQEFMQVW